MIKTKWVYYISIKTQSKTIWYTLELISHVDFKREDLYIDILVKITMICTIPNIEKLTENDRLHGSSYIITTYLTYNVC